MKERSAPIRNAACLLAVMLLGYVLLHDLLGGTLLSHSHWDSYTLQALAWREGRLDLGQNYSWLELAVYEGKYYVSFPPVPTLLMLPLTFVFGADTPNNLVMMLLAMAAALTALEILRRLGFTGAQAIGCALFYVWGSNLLFMSVNGGVWFMAQACSFLLLSLALLCALREKRAAAYLLVALAVGCRPFSAFAFLPLFVFFLEKDRAAGRGPRESLRAQLPGFFLTALCAAAYMALNYARFGNVFEFGHNYLPEFTASAYGQFSLRYLGENLYRLLLLPPGFEDGRLALPWFNGFMFYIANPLFLLLFLRLLRRALRPALYRDRGAYPHARAALLFAMAGILLALCLHKTLGGWQFGARYTVDMLPLAFACLLTLGRWEASPYEYVLMAFGVLFNFYGCAMLWLFG